MPSIRAPQLPKTYEAKGVEEAIYKAWERGGYFKPKHKARNKRARPFVISLPPPNATGTLHLGHATMLALEDLMIRYHRLKGDESLWVPGTDHAAIATNYVVEKQVLKEEGKTRHDLGRKKFLERVNAFVRNSQGTIKQQMRRMGASVDWSRERYTLDEGLSRAVRMVFTMMYDDGLIYRGYRIVNWCPRCQSTLADDEITYQPEKGKLYWLKYGPFTLATARPETKLGDTAVAVHPDDKRYTQYVGKKYQITSVLGPFEITVVADKAVDPNFGSGVIKVTPAHDFTDFEIAERHGIGLKQVIGEDGRMMPNTGKYAGLTTQECREAIVRDMQTLGLIEKIDEGYEHNLALCGRCSTTIEPLPKLQWFVAVNKTFSLKRSVLGKWRKGDKVTLKQLTAYAVRSKQIGIIPDRFGKTYFHWIDNLRDWCISRQIWFGHRIPVWYRKRAISRKLEARSNDESEMYVGVEPPAGNGWVQDEDTLDTWFSSGLWTFSTLLRPNPKNKAATLEAWAKMSPDLQKYHPTSVLETGYDIIFNWVARMVLMTTYALGQIPFHAVYLHGLVRDKQGRKMSKSLGNGIDPVDMINKYGADAVRLSLIIGATPGNDVRLYEEKIAGYRNFVNKLWNISRFILTTTKARSQKLEAKSLADRWILAELNELKSRVTDHLEHYRFSAAGEELYEFTWSKFADWYLEAAKVEGKKDALLRYILHDLLVLWHPFAPFVSERIWQLMLSEAKSRTLRHGRASEGYGSIAKPLIVTEWPQAKRLSASDKQAQQDFALLQQVIVAMRDMRQGIEQPQGALPVHIVATRHKALLQQHQALLERLGRAAVEFVPKADAHVTNKRMPLPGITLLYAHQETTATAASLKKLSREREELQTYIRNLTARLANQEFTSRAPAAIVEKERERLREAEERLKSL